MPLKFHSTSADLPGVEWNTRVLLHTRQPVLAEGFAAILHRRSDFELVTISDSLSQSLACLIGDMPDVALIDMAPEVSLVDLRELHQAGRTTSVILWGSTLPDEFIFQAVQLGVRGLVPARTSIADLLDALHKVHDGELYFPTPIMEAMLTRKRVALTPRESQLVGLVTEGLSNKEIASSLGLTEGTVKVYLTKLFKKLHLNDRLDLALYGLKNLCGNQLPQSDHRLLCPRSLPLREPATRFLN